MMIALRASTSYAVGVGIHSSTAPSSPIPPRRFAVVSKAEPTEKSVEIMRKFSEQYARRSGTYFCVDKGVTSVVIKVVYGFKLL
ncbi:ferredoxin thioredoxin reductase catalytic beta chain family protein [Genlisea aurea]|uniref:Ferredoxin-thioredoxin reductase catalytic chain, chloroplastic n=1 Tax=Genlisea aurea TaxID=192259 RepID=S8D4R6_9LAMI|nr:ferredoxin thioredoxin reductase catalytic beta chain family protein [Genlisea aurea]